MVSDYLKRKRKKYEGRIKEIQGEVSRLETKLIENEKFISLLESETEKVFKDFSPRNVDNKNRRKINELKEERDAYLAQKQSLSQELEESEASLKEIREAILEVKDLEVQAEDSKWFEENVYDAGSENEEPSDETQISGKAAEKLKGILSYLLSDPLRAKMELEGMIQK